MNTDIRIFNFKDNNVRIVLNEKQEPEFCASDVAKILGYNNGPQAIAMHCKTEGITKRYIPSDSGNQTYTFLDEGNIYRLIMISEKPEAEQTIRFLSISRRGALRFMIGVHSPKCNK